LVNQLKSTLHVKSSNDSVRSNDFVKENIRL
jgi:hypothetical protein